MTEQHGKMSIEKRSRTGTRMRKEQRGKTGNVEKWSHVMCVPSQHDRARLQRQPPAMEGSGEYVE
jgi:hypothetical protein